MKKHVKLIIIITMIGITFKSNAQIKMNSSGYTGLDCDPVSPYRLKVYGNFYNSGYAYIYGYAYFKNTYSDVIIGDYNYSRSIFPSADNKGYVGYSGKAFKHIYVWDLHEISDGRKKENIRSINNALNQVIMLNGIKYDLKKEYTINDELEKNQEYLIKSEKERKNKIGFIAQDVQKVIPEAVSYDDSTDVYSISYTRIIPVLVEAMKEQQLIIESLQSEINSLKRQEEKSDDKLKGSSITDKIDNNQTISESVLYQNSPNPFTESTKIEYYLSDNVQNASINIYNMDGTQLKSVELNQLGYGKITINGDELNAGRGA